MLYLLIVMWVFPTAPEKMLMVVVMIFGAHLLPCALVGGNTCRRKFEIRPSGLYEYLSDFVIIFSKKLLISSGLSKLPWDLKFDNDELEHTHHRSSVDRAP